MLAAVRLSRKAVSPLGYNLDVRHSHNIPTVPPSIKSFTPHSGLFRRMYPRFRQPKGLLELIFVYILRLKMYRVFKK